VVFFGTGASFAGANYISHHENSAVMSCSKDLMFGKVAGIIAHDQQTDAVD
jgi:hypothetical protein